MWGTVTEFTDDKVDPNNRASIVSAGAALQNLARLAIQGEFVHVRRLAAQQLMTATDEARRTVLMLVADTSGTPVQSEKCILYFLYLGANPKASDGSGDTAAHLAARRDNVRVLSLLPFHAKWLRNARGANPLMESARTGNWRCAKHLLHLLRQKRFIDWKKQSNSVRLRLLGQIDLEGRTALDMARLSGHSELASYIERETRLVVNERGWMYGLTVEEQINREELQRLVQIGDLEGLRKAATRASCDLPDMWGNTALMWAALNRKYSDEALWEQLLQLADPTCANSDAASFLNWAVMGGNSVAASALLNAGASANATAEFEFTSLMYAAIEAPPDTAAAVGRVLLNSGSDWSLTDKVGKTALDFASWKGKSKLTELLRGYEGKKYFDEPLELISSTNANDPYCQISDENQVTKTDPSTARAVTENATEIRFDKNFYPVTDPQGFCLIININKYAAGSNITLSVEERQGSQQDVERVKQLFKKLHFSVKVMEDLTTEQIDDCLHEIKKSSELATHGSFVCFLMAHGSQGCIYGSDGVPCTISELTAKFKSSICSVLAGKPKIFFIQACRGPDKDETEAKREAIDEPLDKAVRDPAMCPARGDFLVCYAATEGQVSYRDPEFGSIFIQTLCKRIEKHHKEDDLLHIMTRVNRHMMKHPYREGAKVLHRVAQTVGQLAYKVSFDPSRAPKS